MLFEAVVWFFLIQGFFCTYYGILYLIQCNYWFIMLIVSVNKTMELGVLDCLCWTCFFKFCEWKYLCWQILLYPQKEKYPRKCLCENLSSTDRVMKLMNTHWKEKKPKNRALSYTLIDRLRWKAELNYYSTTTENFPYVNPPRRVSKIINTDDEITAVNAVFAFQFP